MNGFAQDLLKDYRELKETRKELLEVESKVDSILLKGKLYHELAQTYFELGKMDEGYSYLEKILTLEFPENIRPEFKEQLMEYIAGIYTMSSELLIRQKKMDKAEEIIRNALPRYQAYPALQSDLYLRLGRIYRLRKNHKSALEAFGKAQSLIK